jgi:hypothetical protein
MTVEIGSGEITFGNAWESSSDKYHATVRLDSNYIRFEDPETARATAAACIQAAEELEKMQDARKPLGESERQELERLRVQYALLTDELPLPDRHADLDPNADEGTPEVTP